MSSYTCNSCLLQFSTSLDQREHMKGDWHRYNLKRRVASLPPITEHVFNEKVQKLTTKNEDETVNSTKKLTKKELRRLEKEKLLEKKKKLLEIAKENMLKQSGKPTEISDNINEKLETLDINTPKIQQEEEEEEEEEKEKEKNVTEEELMNEKISNKVDILLEQCLFCHNKTFKTFENNLEHMFKSHGFYIPEQKYLIDKEGLVKYLGEKIGLGNLCLCCSYQGRSIHAVRAHMLSKYHCKIPYENEDEKLEISEFYDFSSTYNDFNNATTEENDDEEEWEDVDSGEEEEEGEDNTEDISQEYLYNDGYNLHLPTGIKVGHRSLQRYYKQVEKPEQVLTEGQGTVIAAETRHFANIFDRQQIATNKRVWQSQVKDMKRNDKRSAKFINNQTHYRDQLLQ
ncbi:Rei1p SCDLUD_003555 [Saccharomycodes ludwigii]|uniref:Rei1p n=1 Tax=Saccharomycodes ludwigii TaxID=36035 RepID=UPI001E8A829E|nr:hypothetical protein SCDLUD_003555 [Saccharomycodes ludwigii]KAH3900564.1 hypothetical protein SCDLUD_003555 [Saccharomycodes ludwigii]